MCRADFLLLAALSIVWTRNTRADDDLPPEAAPLVALARAAVESEVTGRPMSRDVIAAVSGPAQPVFVTIERCGRVVGCRGDLSPRFATLRDEISQAARAAAAHDPRYRPLSKDDLRSFRVTITIVDRLEPLQPGELATLTPDQGLVLTAGDRTGIVLPWEGRDPAVRVRWAYRKAGVPEGGPCRLRRMFARRFRG